MTILVVILIFNFLLNALMIYLLFISNPAGTINRFLGALLIPITLTNLEMLLFINTGDAPFVGLSLAMFGALFFFPMFYHFSFYFPRKQLSQKSRRTCLTFYIISFCLGLMLLSIIFIPWDKLTMQSFLSWEKTERLPLSLAIFFIGIFGFLVSLLTMTVVRFVSSLSLPLTERERTTVLMIVAGFVPISFVMIFNFFFFRSTSAGYWIYCATSVLHTIYFSVLTFRFGFVDRKRIFRIFVFFPANIGVIAVAYLYAFKPLNRWLSSIFPVNEAFFLGIELVIVSLLFSAVYRAVIRYVDKHFFSSLTNLHEAMIHTQEALDEVIDLDQFCQVLLRFFTGTLKVRTVQFFFLSDERFALYHPFGRSGDVSFSV
ncbi:MAG TPA: hypothetical protein PLG43_12730, partial [Spirochaetia bacterium]|nr:hypothetical protein [Spirochaetia bacterium]